MKKNKEPHGQTTVLTSVNGGGKSESIQFEVFNWLRIPLILLVLYIHIVPNYLSQELTINEVTTDSIPVIIAYALSRVIALVAVPTFFVMSGYLFFRNLNIENKDGFKILKRKLKSRVRTLVTPYILWNYLSAVPFIGLVLWMLGRKGMPEIDINPWTILMFQHTNNVTDIFGVDYFNYYPIDVPLWYVRELIILAILSPIFYYLLRKWGKVLLGVLFLLLLVKVWTVAYIRIDSIFYYMLGAWFSIQNINIVDKCRRIGGYIYVICFVLIAFFTTGLFWDMYGLINIYRIVAIVCAFKIADYCVRNGKLLLFEKFSVASFFIYAYHHMPYNPISLVTSKMMNTSGTDSFIHCVLSIFGYLGSSLFVFVIGLLLFYILYYFKYTRMVLNLFIGGRAPKKN